MPKATESKHAFLSASAAHRWLHCTAAPKLEEQFPDTTSDYAKEGSLAHAIAELKLRKKFIEPMGPRKFNGRMKKLETNPLYNPEMQQCTDEYLDYISGVVLSYDHKPSILAEKKVDYSNVAPGGFGTADCLIIGANILHVIDYKHGKGVPVDAKDNPQMRLYAVGALMEYGMFYPIDTIKMTIVQPRADGDTIKEDEISRDALLDWAVTVVRPAAQAATEGTGTYAAGDWCRFCRAKAQCRARAQIVPAVEAFSDPPMKPFPLLTYAEIGDLLTRAQPLAKWIADVEEYALASLLSGSEIPGWKAVEGRSKRIFDDPDAAFADITASGIEEALLYERKPLTLAQVEKVVGKTKFAEIAGTHVIKQPGKPTIAPESDRRESITNKITAADAFGAAN